MATVQNFIAKIKLFLSFADNIINLLSILLFCTTNNILFEEEIEMPAPITIQLSEADIQRCVDFSRNSAPTQQNIEFGQNDTAPRDDAEISRDTLIGKIAEVAFSNLMENYGLNVDLDWNIYNRGIYDDQDADLNGWKIDVKGTRAGGQYMLIEHNKLNFRLNEDKLSHIYAMFSVGWNRTSDMPTGTATYVGAATLRYMRDTFPRTIVLHRGDPLPGTRNPVYMQADNFAIHFNNLDRRIEGLVKLLHREPDNEMVQDFRQYWNNYYNR